MTPNKRSDLLPSPALFMRGEVPGPLTEEEREWLARQLHAYPKRVDEDRTCSITSLMDMAVTEFCRLMSSRTPIGSDLVERVADAMVSTLILSGCGLTRDDVEGLALAAIKAASGQ